jgi:soluble lytic murein transglycosylase-like protein
MTQWPNENAFDESVYDAASLWNVPVPLIKAVISLESEFVPTATRVEAPKPSLPPTPDFPAGGDESIGLMQLLVRTARVLGYGGPIGDPSVLSGLFDPDTNINLGTRLLGDNLRYAEASGLGIDAAISAYNGGWRPSQGYGGLLPNGQYANNGYVRIVLQRMVYFGADPSTLPQLASAASSSGGAGVSSGATGADVQDLSGENGGGFASLAIVGLVAFGIWWLRRFWRGS